MDFCHKCVDVSTDENADCPVCGRQMQVCDMRSIPPLWNRISHFFLYPLYFPPLLLMLTLVAVNIIVSGSMPGFLVQMLLFVVFTKYAYVVMSSIAKGRMEPEKLRWSMFSQDLESPFKLLFIILCYGLFNTVVQNHTDHTALGLSLLLSSFLFPASIMLLISSQRFFRAINPLTIAGLIKTTGLSYIILFIFLGLLLTGLLSAWELLSASIPAYLFFSVMVLVVMYFVLVMFSMMGYVLYQFHQQLGHIDTLVQCAEEPVDGNEQGVDILLQQGKYQEAVSQLVEEIDLQPNDFALRERLHRILCSIKDENNLQVHSANYIVRLLLLGKPSEAIRIYMECCNLIPGFKLKGAKHRHEMARLLVGSGQSRAALSLLNNLHRDYPSYDGIPNAYMLVARIMFEYFSHEDKARKILEYLMQKYPNHPSRGKTQSYLDILNSISSH